MPYSPDAPRKIYARESFSKKQDADRLHSQLNAAVRMQSRISEKNSRRCDDAPDNPSELNRYLKNGNRTHTLPNLHAWMHYAFYPDRSLSLSSRSLCPAAPCPPSLITFAYSIPQVFCMINCFPQNVHKNLHKAFYRPCHNSRPDRISCICIFFSYRYLFSLPAKLA